MIDEAGRSLGLNLTRASLDATCKYPWTADHPLPDPGGRLKFGVYPDDEDVFRWLRAEAPGRVRCIEAEVMDLSDDIAYSVHDFEDAIVNGYLDPARLAAGGRARARSCTRSSPGWASTSLATSSKTRCTVSCGCRNGSARSTARGPRTRG